MAPTRATSATVSPGRSFLEATTPATLATTSGPARRARPSPWFPRTVWRWTTARPRSQTAHRAKSRAPAATRLGARRCPRATTARSRSRRARPRRARRPNTSFTECAPPVRRDRPTTRATTPRATTPTASARWLRTGWWWTGSGRALRAAAFSLARRVTSCPTTRTSRMPTRSAAWIRARATRGARVARARGRRTATSVPTGTPSTAPNASATTPPRRPTPSWTSTSRSASPRGIHSRMPRKSWSGSR